MANRPIIDNGSGGVGRFPPILLGEEGKLTPEQAKWMSTAVQALTDALNGQLSFGTAEHATRGGNFHSQWIDVYFTSADVEVVIPHGLGRRPVGIFPGIPDKACSFYTTKRGSWSDSLVYLACDTADVTAPILVF